MRVLPTYCTILDTKPSSAVSLCLHFSGNYCGFCSFATGWADILSGETVFSASDGCFFWSTRGRFVGLWMCKHKLEPIPFCICQNLNPNALSSSKLLPTRQRRNRFVLFGLWMCKRKLEQIPFCTCQNPNPNTLSSSQLLPTNKEATLQHLLPMWAKIGDQTLCVLHGALFLNVPPRLQKQNCTFLLMKI